MAVVERPYCLPEISPEPLAACFALEACGFVLVCCSEVSKDIDTERDRGTSISEAESQENTKTNAYSINLLGFIVTCRVVRCA